jgi:hypothetical protein
LQATGWYALRNHQFSLTPNFRPCAGGGVLREPFQRLS